MEDEHDYRAAPVFRPGLPARRKALAVHFNTPMATKHPTGFPDDLILARTLPGPLCFSTIQVGDRGPWQGGPPVDANAAGSVGIVVDVDEQSVIRVDHTDSGFIDGVGSAGRSPTAVTCAASIDRRTTSNEWLVRDFKQLGIFVFLPAGAFVRGQEVS